MKKTAFNEKYCIDKLQELLAIDSTTGYYEEIQDYILKEMTTMGFEAFAPHRGGVVADMGGEGNPLLITAHLDDIGLMVRKINDDGTLNVVNIGGLNPDYCLMDNVRIHTRDGKVYTGSVCRTPGSVHVTEDELKESGDYRKNICVVIDEPVKTPEDVRALGIETGDSIALDPRFTMSNGYIKSHFIDDKACVAVLLTFMKSLKESGRKLSRKVYAYFAAYEENGTGTCWLPDGVKDVLALDIAPTGPDQNSEEHKVSIFAKDTQFPYHWVFTNELREAAKRANADFVMDVFTPHYGSDGNSSVIAGHDIRHAGIGPGTANSHGYERTHIDGLKNTFILLSEYVR